MSDHALRPGSIALRVLALVLAISPLCAQSAPSATPEGKLSLPGDLSVAMVETTMRRLPEPSDLGRWGYQQALYLQGEYLVYKRTGDKRYLAYIKAWADTSR